MKILHNIRVLFTWWSWRTFASWWTLNSLTYIRVRSTFKHWFADTQYNPSSLISQDMLHCYWYTWRTLNTRRPRRSRWTRQATLRRKFWKFEAVWSFTLWWEVNWMKKPMISKLLTLCSCSTDTLWPRNTDTGLTRVSLFSTFSFLT